MKVGTKGLSKGLKKGSSLVKGFSKGLGPAAIGLGLLTAAASAAGLAMIVLNKAMGQMGNLDKLAKFSDSVGVDAQVWRSLQLGAELSGVELSILNKGMQRLVRTLGDAQGGNTKAIKSFGDLGIAAKELEGLSSYDALKKVADGIKELPTAAAKASGAYDLLGRSSADMMTFLEAGSEGMQDFQDEAARLGGSFSRIDLSLVEQSQDSLTKMNFALDSMYQHIAIKISPIITAVITKFTDMGAQGFDMAKMVGKGFKFIVSAIAVVADVLDVVADAFRFLEGVQAKVMAGILQGIAWLGKGLQDFANMIPGVSMTFGDSLQEMADHVSEVADGRWQDAMDEFIKDPPSVGIKKFFTDIEEESRRVAEELTKNSASQAQAFMELNSPALQLIEKYRMQMDVMGMTSREAEIYKMTQEGVSSALTDQLGELDKQITAMQESMATQDALASSAESLRSSLASPIEKYQADIDTYDAMLEAGLISTQEYAKAIEKALPDKVQSIIDDAKSPLDKFKEGLAELDQFKGLELINEDQYQSALTKLREGLDLGPLEQEVKFSGAMEAGSQEARETIFRSAFKTQDQPLNRIQKSSEQQVTELKGIRLGILHIAENTGAEEETVF